MFFGRIKIFYEGELKFGLDKSCHDLKKRPAIATILNNRRDRIDIFKQKSPLYKGFRLDHVISKTNRINALLPLHLATHPLTPLP